jgi:hypothetical protein
MSQHPSVEKLNRPNLAPNKGNNVSEDRSHICSGPQSASRYNTLASGKVPSTKAKG